MKQLFLPLGFWLFIFPAVFSQDYSIENIIEDIRALIQAGRLADAENLTNRYIVDDPVNIDLLMMKGNVVLNKYIMEEQAQLSLRPNYEESIYQINQLEKGPQPVRVSKETAEQVARLWRAATTLAPERTDLHLGICQVYAMAEMDDELLAYLPVAKQHISEVDDLPMQMARYGELLKERGEEAGARRVYEQLLDWHPNHPALLSEMAGTHYYTGQHDMAQVFVQRLLALPDPGETLLGNAFFLSSMMGQYDLALEAIRRLSESEALFYEGILQWYRNDRKWRKSLNKFLETNPGDSEAAVANLLTNKDLQLNEDVYLNIVEQDIGDPAKLLIHLKFQETGAYLPFFHAAETYGFHQNYAAATDLFSAIEQRRFDLSEEMADDFHFYYAWALWQSGKEQAALAHWEALLDSADFYKKSAAHWFVGRYYFDQGEKEKGRTYFAKMASEPSASKFATMCWNYMGE